jgi:cephalosporin-C deacetylase-like acetyl esterase
MGSRSEHLIASGGVDLAAWLYLPDSPTGDVACVVLGHGFSLTRHDGLATFAEAFAAAGVAALVVDWRYLGDSAGEPRQRFRMGDQRADRAAAIAWARAQDGVDPERIIVWGFSMSGGHGVQTAAGDPRVAALLLLCPFLDGLDRVLRTPVGTSARILPKALQDNAGRHVTVPVTAPPGGFGAMTFAGEYDGFMAAVPTGSPWRNEISPGLLTTIMAFRPVRMAKRIRVPVWLGMGLRDITVSNKAIEKFGRQAAQATVVRYPQHDHFSPFIGDASAAIAADQVAFLSTIGVAPDPTR